MNSVHVIPNAGTLLIDDEGLQSCGPVRAATVRRVLGTLIIDDDTAILHADDGTSIVLGDTPRGVAFIRAQAGLPGGQWPTEDAPDDDLTL